MLHPQEGFSGSAGNFINLARGDLATRHFFLSGRGEGWGTSRGKRKVKLII